MVALGAQSPHPENSWGWTGSEKKQLLSSQKTGGSKRARTVLELRGGAGEVLPVQPKFVVSGGEAGVVGSRKMGGKLGFGEKGKQRPPQGKPIKSGGRERARKGGEKGLGGEHTKLYLGKKGFHAGGPGGASPNPGVFSDLRLWAKKKREKRRIREVWGRKGSHKKKERKGGTGVKSSANKKKKKTAFERGRE